MLNAVRAAIGNASTPIRISWWKMWLTFGGCFFQGPSHSQYSIWPFNWKYRFKEKTMVCFLLQGLSGLGHCGVDRKDLAEADEIEDAADTMVQTGDRDFSQVRPGVLIIFNEGGQTG